jgi:alpha-tubulin suppressor-like RCC1 family protein
MSGAVPVAHAMTYTVTNPNDSGSGSLRQAVLDAQSGDTIMFNISGTIPLMSPITLTNSVTIDGTGQSVTISGGGSVQVFVVNSGVTAALQNLTIASGYTQAYGQGGGVTNDGMLTVANSTFTGDVSGDLGGGGIYNSSTLKVDNSTFSGNTGGFDGGAIYSSGTLNVANSTFSGNSTPTGGGTGGANGGGIYNTGTLSVTNSIFSDNTVTAFGGGIYNGGTLSVANSIFSGNATSNGYGGGISNWGPLSVANSTFSGNTTHNGGGGVANEYSGEGTAIVANSTFSGNSSPYACGGGGGVYNDGMLRVVNSTFSGNTSACSAGGGNYPWGGGGIYNFPGRNGGTGGTLNLANTVLADSSGGDCAFAVTDDGGNLADDNTCNFTASSSANNNANLKLGSLANNGGPLAGAPSTATGVQTIALGAGSSAIGAGVYSYCTANLPTTGATAPYGAGSVDERGYTRGSPCDSGAYQTGDGQVYAWGQNKCGQLGDGGANPQPESPEDISGPGSPLQGQTITAVATGDAADGPQCGGFSLALSSNGQVYAWGDNPYGELGDGSTTGKTSPEDISTIQGSALHGVTVTAIAAGSAFSLALGSNGHVYAWGNNGNGTLGDGTTTQRAMPEDVTSNFPAGVTITAIAAGDSGFSLAVGNGQVYAWGLDANYQLGDNVSGGRKQLTPEDISTGSVLNGVTVTAIAAGGTGEGLAVGNGPQGSGQVYAWGYCSQGSLGMGSCNNSSVQKTPADISTGSVLAGVDVTAISEGYGYGLAVGDGPQGNGQVYAWGNNNNGNLGDGTISNSLMPEDISTVTGSPLNGVTVTTIATSGSDYTSLAVGSGGDLYAWGNNNDGQLGDGTTTQRDIPEDINQLAGSPLKGRDVTAIVDKDLFSLAVASPAAPVLSTAVGTNGGTVPSTNAGQPGFQSITFNANAVSGPTTVNVTPVSGPTGSGTYTTGCGTPPGVFGQLYDFTATNSTGQPVTTFSGTNPVELTFQFWASDLPACVSPAQVQICYYPAGSSTPTCLPTTVTGSAPGPYTATAYTTHFTPYGLGYTTSTSAVLYPRLDQPHPTLPVLPASYHFGLWDRASSVQGPGAALLSTAPGATQQTAGPLTLDPVGDYPTRVLEGEFLSPPLAAQTLPAGSWTVGEGIETTLLQGSGLSFSGYAAIYLINGGTGKLRGEVGEGWFGAYQNTGGREESAYGTVPGAGLAVQAGDYLEVELGVQSESSSSSAAAMLSTSGSSPITADGATTSNAQTFLEAPGQLTFQ